MKQWPLVWVAALTLTSACRQNGDASKQSATFDSLSGAFVKGYLDWRPQAGIALGFHEYDTMVTDYSQASMQNEIDRLRRFDSLFGNMDVTWMTQQHYHDMILSDHNDPAGNRGWRRRYGKYNRSAGTSCFGTPGPL